MVYRVPGYLLMFPDILRYCLAAAVMHSLGRVPVEDRHQPAAAAFLLDRLERVIELRPYQLLQLRGLYVHALKLPLDRTDQPDRRPPVYVREHRECSVPYFCHVKVLLSVHQLPDAKNDVAPDNSSNE